MSVQSKLRIAICGGGIAGLTLACSLANSTDIEVDVYETAAHFEETGAGLGVWWRAQRILQALGLDVGLATVGYCFTTEKVPCLNCYKADQAVAEKFATVEARGGFITLHRPEFQSLLLRRVQNAPNCATHNLKRLVSYAGPAGSVTDPITLCFQDGTTAECDVLVGADGIKSATRAVMLENMAQATQDAAEAGKIRDLIAPQYSGIDYYRPAIQAAKLRELSPNCPALSEPSKFVGKDRAIVAYPISRGELINVTVVDAKYAEEGRFKPEPWVSEVAASHEIIDPFKNWEENARHLAACVAAHPVPVKKWSIHVVKPLPSFVYGKVALMGDAAHAMQPFLGSGAGQAIEDAYTLATILSHPLTDKTNVTRALEVYSRVRVPIARFISDLSRKGGMCSTLYGEDKTDEEGMRELGERMIADYEIPAETDPMVGVKRAVEMLETELEAG